MNLSLSFEMNQPIVIILVSTLFHGLVSSAGYDEECYQQVMEKANESNYNKNIPPFPKNGSPLSVYAAFIIDGLSAIQTVTMDFDIDTYFILRWTDHRLAYDCGIKQDDYTIIANDVGNAFWSPGIYFSTTRKAQFHNVLLKNSAIRLYPNGHIRMSTRVTMKVVCNMKLAVYPFDTQYCSLDFMDYSFSNTFVNVSWMPESIEPRIWYSKSIVIPEMTIATVSSRYCDGSYSSGVWSCLQMNIVLERIKSYHLLQTYLPSTLVVLMSFTNFWLDVDAMPGRITLSITTLLTLATQASSLRLALPPVSYMKAVDIWMLMCQFFCIGALLEFTLVNYISRKYKAEEWKQIAAMKLTSGNTINVKPVQRARNAFMEATKDEDNRQPKKDISSLALHDRYQAQAIDKVARWLFPVLFLFFNVIYWPYYMILANKK